MGAWGPGLFSDDTACDVRNEFRDLIGEGLTAEEATEQILASYPSVAEDPDEGSVVLIALAVTQWKTGRLLEVVRDQAVAAIDAGADLGRWEEDGTVAGGRRRALARAREQLLSPQRAPVRIARRHRPATPFEAGDVLLYTHDSGRQVVFWVERNHTDNGGTYSIMEALGTDPQDAIRDPGTVEGPGSCAGSGRRCGCTPARPGTDGKTRPLTASSTFISAASPGYVPRHRPGERAPAMSAELAAGPARTRRVRYGNPPGQAIRAGTISRENSPAEQLAARDAAQVYVGGQAWGRLGVV